MGLKFELLLRLTFTLLLRLQIEQLLQLKFEQLLKLIVLPTLRIERLTRAIIIDLEPLSSG